MLWSSHVLEKEMQWDPSYLKISTAHEFSAPQKEMALSDTCGQMISFFFQKACYPEIGEPGVQ